jgi:CheY-like chemotaxis protein
MSDSIRLTIIEDSADAAKRMLEMFSKKYHTEMQHISFPPFFDESIEEAIKRFHPALIVLDLLLIGDSNSGKRVLRSLKQSPAIKNIPVIVCSKFITSGKKSDQLIKELLEVGAAQVLPKVPFPKVSELMHSLPEDADPIAHP